MTMQNICAGAPSHQKMNWHSIDWAKCNQEVRRLQVRIVKATQEGRYGKVKALQYLLTHSFSAKALAVRRVTENQGKKTAGVDRKLWDTPNSKIQALLSLKRHGYKPLPLRRIYIPKSNGKKRPLSIPTMRDRAMQALYLLALEPIAETTADRNSYGFRPARSTADAIEQCFCVLGRKDAAEWVLEGDIKGCFDNISHEWLIKNICMDKKILHKWLKAGYIYRQTHHPTEVGAPQGGTASPALANMTLDGLEKLLAENFYRTSVKNVMINPKVRLIRYADDFIITGNSKELLEKKVKPLVEKFLKIRGLELSAEKTKITHINEGFDFLGQNVRKYKNKLLIKPAKKNIKTFLDKVRKVIKSNKTAKQASLIKTLNPIIKGWAEYHRHVVAAETFRTVDSAIWKTLWQWAKRRHSNKGKRWIKAKYFIKVGNRNWMFGINKTVTKNRAELRSLTDTKIKRHRKVRAEANPYDPEWEVYFESRMSFKMKQNLLGKKKLLNLWLKQNEECPVCNQHITAESGWHIHHILPKCEGGKDTSSNLIMVHPNCHMQIHSQRLKVVKPVLEKGLKKA